MSLWQAWTGAPEQSLQDTLKRLKSECTILVVSHDLRELTPLVRDLTV